MCFFPDLSRAQRSFAQVLNDFRFECIGEVETDDEIHIGKLNYVYFPFTSALRCIHGLGVMLASLLPKSK